jgi:phosphatidylethanolamine/phosphatidyl-N-methylethanolamine N-methyltransferase
MTNGVSQNSGILGADGVRAAYSRLANHYDNLFGPILSHARMAAISAVNRLPGTEVLEVGVGTGLALPHYSPSKRITGIDLSCEMLTKAGERAAKLGLHNVDAVVEMDAQATEFEPSRFDIAAVMFVASVAPNPRALMDELRRVVKPGGNILFVNHFAQEQGLLSWCERAAAPISTKLGWHADFQLSDIFSPSDLERATISTLRPFGFFRLVVVPN